MDVLEDMDLESEQMDKIYDALENLGIDTAGEDYLPELRRRRRMPPIEEMEEIPEEEIVDPNTLVDSFGIDDPVRMYLKEIGKVNLLTPERGGRAWPRPWAPAQRRPRSSWRRSEAER